MRAAHPLATNQPGDDSNGGAEEHNADGENEKRGFDDERTDISNLRHKGCTNLSQHSKKSSHSRSSFSFHFKYSLKNLIRITMTKDRGNQGQYCKQQYGGEHPIIAEKQTKRNHDIRRNKTENIQ